MKKNWCPKPRSVRLMTFKDLPHAEQDAVYEAILYWTDPTMAEDCTVRIERYTTAEIRRMVERVWKWACCLESLDNDAEKVRVQKIIDLIRSGKPQWPYVNYWATDLEELMETIEEDDGLSIPNHCDGWHRIIAAVELKLPYIDMLFIEAKPYD